MQLSFDATRFGFGLDQAIEYAAAQQLAAVDFSFEPFEGAVEGELFSQGELEYLTSIKELSKRYSVVIACIALNYTVDYESVASVAQFHAMMRKLGPLAAAVNCRRISFRLHGAGAGNWLELASEAINPVLQSFREIQTESEESIKLLLSLSTGSENRGRSLRQWHPLDPQAVRDLIAHCPGLSLSLSPADLAWQSINYLQVLPGFMQAIEHIEANDIEINRELLQDGGLFGTLWWRYRRPSKGAIDWRQLIEALKMYEFGGALSIRLDDEFLSDDFEDLNQALDDSVKFFSPLLRY